MPKKPPIEIDVGPDEEWGFAADPKGLPGYRSLGLGATPEEAVGHLIMTLGIVEGTGDDHPQQYEYTSTGKFPLFKIKVKDK